MNDMNAAQCAASRHRDGPALVLACPGSGKTYTLVRRLKNLIADPATDPSSILTLTFTNQAAKEMKSRAVSLMGDAASYMTFGTFHSVFYSMLRQAFSLSSSNILKKKDKYMILRDIAYALKLDMSDMSQLADELSLIISRHKNGCEMTGGPYEECVTDIIRLYEERLKELRLIDFDDMVLKCRALLMKDPGLCRRYRKRYRYIQIDEFQDINRSQYDVVKLIAGEDCNIFAVGDDDQSIYGFRGAGYGIMKQFIEEHEKAEVFELAINYRCPAPIAEAADRVIEQNRDRIKKTHSSFNLTGDMPDIRVFKDRKEETDAIARLISGKDPSDTALLVRTNSLAGYYAEELERRGIKTRFKGKRKSLYDTPAGRDVMAYMRLAAGLVSIEDIIRVLNKPMRYLSREAFSNDATSLHDAKRYYLGRGEVYDRACGFVEDIERMGRMNPKAAMRYLMNVTGYRGFAVQSGIGLKELKLMEEDSSRYCSIRQWIRAVSEDGTEKCRISQDDDEGVYVMTLHASKGLEFANVIIADADAGVIPGSRAQLIEDIEEERRLLYVGMTRASGELHIFCTSPSPFLKPFLSDAGEL